jgi:hypothetical protein
MMDPGALPEYAGHVPADPVLLPAGGRRRRSGRRLNNKTTCQLFCQEIHFQRNRTTSKSIISGIVDTTRSDLAVLSTLPSKNPVSPYNYAVLLTMISIKRNLAVPHLDSSAMSAKTL